MNLYDICLVTLTMFVYVDFSILVKEKLLTVYLTCGSLQIDT